ncbi:MAG: RHS repeat-associated core domain-containing protein [Terriglobales bacterium]
MNGAISESCVSLAFGDGQSCTGADPSPLHFTGKQRDPETNLDYVGARYDASWLGRFMTPDWSKNPTGILYANFANPQSLNLYAYMLTNPVSGVDPDGHWPWDKPKPLPPPDANHQHTLTIREVSGQNGNSLGHITVQIDKGKEVGFGPHKDMTKGQLAENKSVPGKVEPLRGGSEDA